MLGPFELGTAVVYSREDGFKEGTLSTVVEVEGLVGMSQSVLIAFSAFESCGVSIKARISGAKIYSVIVQRNWGI